VEANYEGGTYYFSTALEPSEHTSYTDPLIFLHLPCFNVKNTDIKIENILPFAFPFGIGGPSMKRRVKVSLELCIQLYMCLSLEQFMEGPTILVMNHIFNRIMSYKTGVMTCRSSIDGIQLGEKFSTLSTEDFKQINDHKNNDQLNATTKSFLRTISTTCKAMGHTEQAAKDARRRCFAMLDFFGLNSLFMSTTPDDECNLRVKLYSRPHYWVSSYGNFFLSELKNTEFSETEKSVFSALCVNLT
jgi:hypothetical protein